MFSYIVFLHSCSTLSTVAQETLSITDGLTDKRKRVHESQPPARAIQRSMGVPVADDVCIGTIKRNNGKSGFIEQDSGEADLFPPTC